MRGTGAPGRRRLRPARSAALTSCGRRRDRRRQPHHRDRPGPGGRTAPSPRSRTGRRRPAAARDRAESLAGRGGAAAQDRGRRRRGGRRAAAVRAAAGRHGDRADPARVLAALAGARACADPTPAPRPGPDTAWASMSGWPTWPGRWSTVPWSSPSTTTTDFEVAAARDLRGGRPGLARRRRDRRAGRRGADPQPDPGRRAGGRRGRRRRPGAGRAGGRRGRRGGPGLPRHGRPDRAVGRTAPAPRRHRRRRRILPGTGRLLGDRRHAAHRSAHHRPRPTTTTSTAPWTAHVVRYSPAQAHAVLRLAPPGCVERIRLHAVPAAAARHRRATTRSSPTCRRSTTGRGCGAVSPTPGAPSWRCSPPTRSSDAAATLAELTGTPDADPDHRTGGRGVGRAHHARACRRTRWCATSAAAQSI